ncbi:zf-HC2 domain-containing protein [Candidatus Poribacteria bacterium]|nr:zf-HC2 domain-containing protein [Candidatus Poribacteria bacterium]
MNHKNIQSKLLLYIDGDLSGNEMSVMQKHIEECPICKKYLDELCRVWKLEKSLEKRESSPYLWTRLNAQINEYEQNKGSNIKQLISSLMRPAAISLLIFITITTGYYLEGFLSNNTKVNADTVNEEIAKIFYIDTLKSFPMESIDNEFITASNENSE